MILYPAKFDKYKDGAYTVQFVDFQGCITEGDNLEEAKANAAEALAGVVESVFEHGRKIPRPSRITGRGHHLIALPPDISIPLELRFAREDMHLTQTQMAKRVGMAVNQYQRLERTHGFNPTFRSLSRALSRIGKQVALV